MSTDETGPPGRDTGGRYLDKQLTLLGFGGRGANAELSRITGLGESVIGKMRRGKSMPTRKSLRTLLNGIAPIARDRGIHLDPSEFYFRFGLIGREDVKQQPVDPLYVDLVQVDREAGMVGSEEQERLREHVRLLIEITRARLAEQRERSPGRQRRRAS